MQGALHASAMQLLPRMLGWCSKHHARSPPSVLIFLPPFCFRQVRPQLHWERGVLDHRYVPHSAVLDAGWHAALPISRVVLVRPAHKQRIVRFGAGCDGAGRICGLEGHIANRVSGEQRVPAHVAGCGEHRRLIEVANRGMMAWLDDRRMVHCLCASCSLAWQCRATVLCAFCNTGTLAQEL